jgi:cyclase
MTSKIKIPVIACSGIGQYEQYKEGVYAGASAVAAANIWHFKELSDLNGKRALKKAGVDARL